MNVNLDFFVTGTDGSEYQVVCSATCSGNEPDHTCDTSDWDCRGYFSVDSVDYEKISGCTDTCEDYELTFDQCSPELQIIIEVNLYQLAEIEYKKRKG